MIVTYERVIREAYKKLKKATEQIWLTINQEKRKFMEVSDPKTVEQYITTDNERIEKVKEFQYIGSIVTCDNNMNMEINHRITMGNTYYGLL
jgi:hypothetical protein